MTFLEALQTALRRARQRRAAARLRPEKRVAVAVPLSDRPGFTSDEEIALRHLDRHLGRHDRFFIAPPPLRVEREGYGIQRFPERYFGSAMRHRDLILSPGFYLAFADYRFVLIHHLDALAFSDELISWCERGYDYIGAPWVVHPDAPYAGEPAYENKVGNGGFSLRSVPGFLRFLLSRRKAVDSAPDDAQHPPDHGGPLRRALRAMAMQSSLFNHVEWEISLLHYASEERFIANRATHYDPSFRIAPLEVALEFAFECVPRHCFELNGRRLPFGCHAWAKYDRAFWEPHLLTA